MGPDGASQVVSARMAEQAIDDEQARPGGAEGKAHGAPRRA
jgi:hypothetical protein